MASSLSRSDAYLPIRGVSVIVCAVLLLAAVQARAQPIPIAVAEFDYVDTSGEPRDQRAEHAVRLEAFAKSIRADLERSGKYRVVTLSCRQPPCSAARS